MSELTFVNINDLKVGDTVGYCRYPEFGWNSHFRYPIIQRKVIERITPKRTKFVLNGDIEFGGDVIIKKVFRDTKIVQ